MIFLSFHYFLEFLNSWAYFLHRGGIQPIRLIGGANAWSAATRAGDQVNTLTGIGSRRR
jgi:hypothetical protein